MNLNALLHVTVPQAPSAGEVPEQGASDPPKKTEGPSFAEDLQSYLDIPPQVPPAAVVPAAMPIPVVPEIGHALLDGMTPPLLATAADLLSPSPLDIASVPAAVGAAIPAFPLVDVNLTINTEQPPVIGEFNPALAVQPQSLPTPANVSATEVAVRFMPANTETVLPTLPETQVPAATPMVQETPMAALPNVTPAASTGEASSALGLPLTPTAVKTTVSPPAAATETTAPRAGSVNDLLARRTPDQGFMTASTLSEAASASATQPNDDPAAAALQETSARPADVAQAALNGPTSPEGSSSRPALSVHAQLGNAILARLEVRTRENRTEFHMNLEPPELGSVRVHLTITDNTVTARMMVHEESARQLIESQMHSLRQRLMEAGISVGRFDVTQDGAGARDHPRHRLPEPFALPGTLAADALRQPRLPGELLASKRLIDIMV